ncbi:peroxisomal membrane anchor protein conserved region-domain-containing protein [Hypomontagnella submonticulosa]|nr:peroxisomal membrane anchor protein conserved region-domain-containing protein [Hypomontagnella submonticulosa]
MTDSKRPNIPPWQQPQSREDAPDAGASQDADATEVTLDHARMFLRNEDVRKSSIEKKIEFLKSKGFDDAQIQTVLKEVEQDAQASNRPTTTDGSASRNEDVERSSEASRAPETTTRAQPSDAPPIITYPEFLTNSPKPPPLITPSRLANILTISGSIWTLLYGTTRFVVSPMVETLNDARTDYYAHVSEKLGQFVEKLEGAVSEVPYKNGKLVLKSKQKEDAYEDDESTFSDPTELFHRDIGTQTSPARSEASFSGNRPSHVDKPIDAQLRRLTALRASLREVNDMHLRRAEDTADMTALVREIRDEVDKLGAPPLTDFTSTYGGLGYGRSTEPDDEVKKTKDAIRSVKGMFLSSRSFPTTAAR